MLSLWKTVSREKTGSLNEMYNTPALVFLTNSLGEDTGHEDIKKQMRNTYEDVKYLSNVGALLYLAKVNGVYGILANYEFDDEYCAMSYHGDRKKMNAYVHQLAGQMDRALVLEQCDILVGDASGIDGCDELAIFVNLFKPQREIVSILRKADQIVCGKFHDTNGDPGTAQMAKDVLECYEHSSYSSKNRVDDTVMKEKMLEYLENFIIQSNWTDEKTPEQARALFTAICLMENIDADTFGCDKILGNLYWLSALEETIEYEEFVNFMVKYIV